MNLLLLLVLSKVNLVGEKKKGFQLFVKSLLIIPNLLKSRTKKNKIKLKRRNKNDGFDCMK